jgi:peptidoglycan/LPS O-acetylase OafA/YrhL
MISDKLGHIKGFDGLRAVAIILVLFEHWTPKDSFLNQWLPTGTLGVNLFFVLSGFLIGRILLNDFFSIGKNELSKLKILKQFYIRRALRIFPVYFLFLLSLILLGYKDINTEKLGWLFTYTSNIGIVFYNLELGYLTHLWSLAVEEQFYLIFPILLFALNRIHPFYIIFSFITLGPLLRITLYLSGNQYFSWFTLSTFDYFGFGILLAYLKLKSINIRYSFSLMMLCFGLYLYLQSGILHFYGKSFLGVLLPLLPMSYMLLLDYTYTIQTSLFVRFLELKPFQFIGKISYGVYLFHFVFLNWFPMTGKFHWFFNFIFLFSITILVALISFVFFESPINRLKKKFY